MIKILSTKIHEVFTKKKNRKTSCFIRVSSWMVFFFLSVNSQNLHKWGNIGLFHGLPSEKVQAIAQTSDGILWFATENGLAKFDGRRVQTISLEQVTSILCLAVGLDGRLFVGTNNGLAIYQNGAFEIVAATRSEQINSIISAQKTYFATESGTIFELEKSATKQIAKLDLPVRTIAIKDQILYFGTQGRGLMQVENEEQKEIFGNSRPYFINDLAIGKNGEFWIGSNAKSSNSGLYEFSESQSFINSNERIGTVNAMRFDGKGELWVGTKDNGIYHFRGDDLLDHFTFENTLGGLRSNQIFDIFIDREGVIWVGTDKGVCRFDALSPSNAMFGDDINANFIRTLYQGKDGNVYAGTNLGLFTFNNSSDGEGWFANEMQPNKSIYTISDDAENKLIIGNASNNIRSIQTFDGKTYTAKFGEGLFENERLIFANDSVTTLFAEKEKLYIGTGKSGVFTFDSQKITQLEILKNNAIWKISGTTEKGLWFATERGIFRLQNTELIEVIPNTDFRSLLVGEEIIYAGSANKGLFEINFDEEFGWLFSNLNIEQGLPSSGIFSLLPVGKSLLIGTGKGVSKYSPNEIKPEISPVRIVSERLHSNDEIKNGINLDYPQNSLSIEVTGISSRTYPENFQYGILLKNGKGDIVSKKLTKDAQISFLDLSPGNYDVEIRAFNQDLVSSLPFKLHFSVGKAPFPWTSTALAVLLAIALLALIWAIIERRQIVKKNKEIAAARFDLANEAERERRRISRDLHDQTLADLRNLMIKSDKLPSKNSEFRQEIESVSDEIRRICEDLSPSVLENIGLTAALEFLLGNTIENHKFLCANDLEQRMSFSPTVQMQIFRITQEVLNNIKRHANADFVEMKISDDEGFKLTIENNGKAFSPDFDNLPKGRGISNIKSRAELIEAEISWQINETETTIFTLNKLL
jgi:signal transduction histidine kinase/ligand-binding sensor domain-containing protein